MIAKKYLLYGEYWEGTHIDSISKVFKQKKINHEIFNFFPLIHKQLGSRIANALYRKTFHFYNERKVNRDLLNKIELYKPDVFIVRIKFIVTICCLILIAQRLPLVDIFGKD